MCPNRPPLAQLAAQHSPAIDGVLLANLLLQHKLADGGQGVGKGLRLGLLLLGEQCTTAHQRQQASQSVVLHCKLQPSIDLLSLGLLLPASAAAIEAFIAAQYNTDPTTPCYRRLL